MVDRAKVEVNFRPRFYDEKACAKCPYLEDRHGYHCESCDSFLGRIKLYSTKTIGGRRYIGLPSGDLERLPRRSGFPKAQLSLIVDQRNAPRSKAKIAFTGKLRSYQRKPTAKFIKALGGMLCAPPRTGKTVMGVYVTIKFGLKTLILTNQDDLLQQFMKEFDDHTDHKDVAWAKHRPVVGIVKRLEDFDRFDVCLCTYQKLIGPYGKPRLKAIKNKFGLILVDEVHRASANEFAGVINGLNAKHKFGLTATPERKDGRHWIGQCVIGPVVATSARQALKPSLYIVQLPYVPPRSATPVTWNGWSSWWAKDKKRNKAIVALAVRAIKVGRSVLITSARVKHCHELADAVNKHFDEPIAEAFVGATKDRKELLNRARKGKIRCVIGMRSIIATGVNVPRWDTLLEVWPISNKPNHYQEIMRIATPDPKKKPPVIIHLLTGGGPEFGCFRTCWPVYEERCNISTKTRAAAGLILGRSRRQHADAAEAEAAKREDGYKPKRLF